MMGGITTMTLAACLLSLASPPETTTGTDDASVALASKRGLGSGLVVRVDPELPQAAAVQGWIEERGQQVLSKRARPLGDEELIRVVVRGGPFDYRISIELRRRSQRLDDQPEALRCECGSDQMLEEIGAAIGDAADRLAADRGAEELAAARERRELDLEEEGPGGSSAQEGQPRQRTISSLGWVGITSEIIGSGLVIAGVSMLHVSRRGPEHGELRAPGLALAGSGAGLVVLGITFIAVDVVRCGRHPERCERRSRRNRRGDAALVGERWREVHRGGGEPMAIGGGRW